MAKDEKINGTESHNKNKNASPFEDAKKKKRSISDLTSTDDRPYSSNPQKSNQCFNIYSNNKDKQISQSKERKNSLQPNEHFISKSNKKLSPKHVGVSLNRKILGRDCSHSSKGREHHQRNQSNTNNNFIALDRDCEDVKQRLGTDHWGNITSDEGNESYNKNEIDLSNFEEDLKMFEKSFRKTSGTCDFSKEFSSGAGNANFFTSREAHRPKNDNFGTPNISFRESMTKGNKVLVEEYLKYLDQSLTRKGSGPKKSLNISYTDIHKENRKKKKIVENLWENAKPKLPSSNSKENLSADITNCFNPLPNGNNLRNSNTDCRATKAYDSSLKSSFVDNQKYLGQNIEPQQHQGNDSTHGINNIIQKEIIFFNR